MYGLWLSVDVESNFSSHVSLKGVWGSDVVQRLFPFTALFALVIYSLPVMAGCWETWICQTRYTDRHKEKNNREENKHSNTMVKMTLGLCHCCLMCVVYFNEAVSDKIGYVVIGQNNFKHEIFFWCIQQCVLLFIYNLNAILKKCLWQLMLDVIDRTAPHTAP